MKIEIGSELVQAAVRVIKNDAGPKEDQWPGRRRAMAETAFLVEVFLRLDPDFDLFGFVKASMPDGMNLGMTEEEAKALYDNEKALVLAEFAKENSNAN